MLHYTQRRQSHATLDELKELNLGTIDDPHLIFIGALLSLIEKEELNY